MPFGQLFAGWLVILFLAIGAVGFIRLSRVPTLVVVISWLGVPILAFATYVFAPQPLGSFDTINVGLASVAFGLALALASVLLRIAKPSGTFRSLLRRAPLFLLAWPCVVVAISSLVFPFEPAFAVANILLNALWFLMWIPRSLRRMVNTDSYELPASPERVFAYVSRPANWPLYRHELQSAEARPDGPLREGTEIIARRRIEYRGLRGPRLLLPAAVESVEVVTAVLEDQMIATRRSDGVDATATLEFRPAAGARTLVSMRSSVVLPYRLAVVGGAIEAQLGKVRQRQMSLDARARLGKLLEQTPPAQ